MTAVHILSLGSFNKWLLSHKLQMFYPEATCHHYPVHRRLDLLRSLSGHFRVTDDALHMADLHLAG